MRIAALDIGGTRIKAGLFEEGKLLRTDEADTMAKQGAKVMLQNAVKLLESIGPFDAVGISTAGQVDPNTGIIRYANENLPGYTGTNVQAFFADHFHCPCAVMNDAYCAAVGEGTDGAAKGQADYICITYGTGIGGGVILDHQPYYGKGGSANLMIGGLITHPERRDPNDPFAGSYERCASTAALVRIAEKADPSLDNGRRIFARIEEANVKEAVNAWLDEVTVGLLSILHIYNIPCLVLGGGILEQPFVLAEIQKRIRASAIPGFQDVTIVSAQLGNQAGLYGAMRNVKEKITNQ
ncbi:MAG: ROK family protein [Solobacterium sp.]|jgi:predicted NBD/HSP70 family sugar kinase|nr:ROK family protein [Solobacterium sp.]MCH4227396.1 ROK family protein [Solobacterium sp.]